MTNPQNKITQTYAQDDVQQILQLALVHRSEGGELTKAQLLGLAQFLSPNIAQTLSVRGKNQYDY